MPLTANCSTALARPAFRDLLHIRTDVRICACSRTYLPNRINFLRFHAAPPATAAVATAAATAAAGRFHHARFHLVAFVRCVPSFYSFSAGCTPDRLPVLRRENCYYLHAGTSIGGRRAARVDCKKSLSTCMYISIYRVCLVYWRPSAGEKLVCKSFYDDWSGAAPAFRWDWRIFFRKSEMTLGDCGRWEFVLLIRYGFVLYF